MQQEQKSGQWWIALKTLIFAALVPGTVTVIIPWLLVSNVSAGRGPVPLGLQFLGAMAIILGLMVGCWCMVSFAFKGKGTPAPIDPPKHLVASGLYRFTRNPMYVAVTSILLGESAFFGSPTLLVYAMLCVAGFNLFVRFYEEPALKRKFGAAYEEYCSRVPRWLPRWPRGGERQGQR